MRRLAGSIRVCRGDKSYQPRLAAPIWDLGCHPMACARVVELMCGSGVHGSWRVSLGELGSSRTRPNHVHSRPLKCLRGPWLAATREEFGPPLAADDWRSK